MSVPSASHGHHSPTSSDEDSEVSEASCASDDFDETALAGSEDETSEDESSADGSSEDESGWNYTPISEVERAKTPYTKLSKEFTDVEVPGCPEEFEIVDVCRCDKDPRLFYKYIRKGCQKEADGDFEYTPCEEIVNSDTYIFESGSSDPTVLAPVKTKKSSTKGSFTYELREEANHTIDVVVTGKRRTRNAAVSYKA